MLTRQFNVSKDLVRIHARVNHHHLIVILSERLLLDSIQILIARVASLNSLLLLLNVLDILIDSLEVEWPRLDDNFVFCLHERRPEIQWHNIVLLLRFTVRAVAGHIVEVHLGEVLDQAFVQTR